MSQVLCTGSTGLIGSHMLRYLKEKGKQVVATVYSEPKGKFLAETLKDVKVVGMDIRLPEYMLETVARFNVSEIYHFAALAKVGASQKDPYNTFNTNIMGTVSILEAARHCDVDRVLIMMTDKVYGNKQGATENSPLQVSEVYGASKACQRLVAESYIETYGLDVVIPHSCNVFGFDPYSNRIFPNVIKKAIQGESPYIYQNDKSLREYIFVDDLVEALYTLMGSRKHSNKGYTGCFNISTGWVYDNEAIVLKILEHFDDVMPVYTKWENPPKQVDVTTMKSIRKEFTWKPSWSMDEAIDATVSEFIHYIGDWL